MTLGPNYRARVGLRIDEVRLPKTRRCRSKQKACSAASSSSWSPAATRATLADGGVITYTQDSLIVGELLDLIIAEAGAAARRGAEQMDAAQPH